MRFDLHKFLFVYLAAALLLLNPSALLSVSAHSDGSYLKLIAQKRADMESRFRDPVKSPLNALERAAFKGLSFYAVDDSFRVTARFWPNEMSKRPIIMANYQTRRTQKLGDLVFTLNGTTQRLAVYANPSRATRNLNAPLNPKTETLVVPFKDATNGKETQPEGRLVAVEKISDTDYVIDFNLAFNPDCAYNKEFACPTIARDSVLSAAIKAGEKKFQSGLVPTADGTQLYAFIGNFVLASGQSLRDCKLGYRTYGKLNADKSNAILFPSWFMGKSDQLATYIGADKMLDPNKYFIIATDALGNGISSSPTNTPLTAGQTFPRLAIRDMVNADYKLVTSVLGIRKLAAVVGISMGGMQVFDWVVAYPDMMEKAIPILGTPQQTSADKLLWTTELKAIEEARRTTGNGDNAGPLVARIHAMALVTPPYRNRATPSNEYEKFIEREENNYKNFSSADWQAQLQAMIDHDVTRSYGYSLTQTSWQIRALMLVVASRQDHMVNPEPALELARLTRANVYEINNDCGHLFANCDGANMVYETVARFIAGK